MKFKAIDSPERLSSKIYPRYFTFACCLISMSLYAIFKGLSFRNLCLVTNNTDFVLSCPKCILNLLSTNQSHKLKKSLISCFSISILLLCWKSRPVLSAQSNESLTTAWGKSSTSTSYLHLHFFSWSVFFYPRFTLLYFCLLLCLSFFLSFSICIFLYLFVYT